MVHLFVPILDHSMKVAKFGHFHLVHKSRQNCPITTPHPCYKQENPHDVLAAVLFVVAGRLSQDSVSMR